MNPLARSCFPQRIVAIAAFLLVLPFTVLLVAVWVFWLFWVPSRILPPQRHRAVPWDGYQVFFVAVTVLLFCPWLAQYVVSATSLLTGLYGPNFATALQKRETFALARATIWVAVLAFPLQVAAFIALVKLSGGRCYQLGVTGRHISRDVLLGFLGVCAVAPLVFSVNAIVTLLWKDYIVAPVQQHPLEKISETQPTLIDWVLIFTSAVVTAAILEELLFRGVLQSWFASRRHGGDIAMIVTLGVAVLQVADPVSRVINEASQQLPDDVSGWGRWSGVMSQLFTDQFRPLILASAALLFALAMGVVYLLLRWRVRSATVKAIFGTALLFGIVHSSVWPTPVSLFLLALGLGTIFYRTQSIVPSIVMHGLFNFVSFIQLVAQAAKHAKGS